MVESHSDEMTVLSTMEGPPPGTILLDKYRVDWMLGAGGYGWVVKAHHLEHGGDVAIKIMRDDREADAQTVGRFEREGRVVAKLESEHVARVFDVGKLPTGAPYMVMELLEGDDLRTRLESGPLAITPAVDFLMQACEALAEAHAHGIVHRDIKPGNLFLAQLPAKRTILKVLDFGISKSNRTYDKRLTQTQSILGTPAYMSPEQMRDPRSVGFATDIWALGAVLYELVEGVLPFDADNFAELVIAVSTEPMRPMQNAPALRPIVERCLAKDPAARYQSIAELAVALAPFGTETAAREYVDRIHRLLGEPPPSERSVAPPPEPQPAQLDSTTSRQSTRFPWLPVAMIGGLAVAAVVVAVALRGGSTEEPQVRVEPSKPPTKVEPRIEKATAPPKIEPEPPRVEPPKVDEKPTVVVKKPLPPIKKQPVVAVPPPPIKPGLCPDGTPVARYMDGKCPKRKS